MDRCHWRFRLRQILSHPFNLRKANQSKSLRISLLSSLIDSTVKLAPCSNDDNVQLQHTVIAFLSSKSYIQLAPSVLKYSLMQSCKYDIEMLDQKTQMGEYIGVGNTKLYLLTQQNFLFIGIQSEGTKWSQLLLVLFLVILSTFILQSYHLVPCIIQYNVSIVFIKITILVFMQYLQYNHA